MRSQYNLTRTSREDRSPIAANAIARLILLVGLAGMLGLLSAGSALAFDEVDYEVKSKDLKSEQERSSIEWRSTGIAYIELPLGFRARFDATATRNLYHSEDLAEAFNAGGPQLRYRRSLESRVSISRALTQNMEFEIAWGARSPIENVNLLNFQRQTVGALLRIVH